MPPLDIIRAPVLPVVDSAPVTYDPIGREPPDYAIQSDRIESLRSTLLPDDLQPDDNAESIPVAEERDDLQPNERNDLQPASMPQPVLRNRGGRTLTTHTIPSNRR